MSDLPHDSDDAQQPPATPPDAAGNLIPRAPTAVEARAMALVALMTDGDLSPEEHEELRGIFRAHPELLQSYVEQAVSHAVLEWRYAQVSDDTGAHGTDETAGPDSQTFEVHGQLSLRPLGGGSGGMPAIPPRPHTQLPDASRPAQRPRRWPMLAAGVAAGAAIVAVVGLIWTWWADNRRPANSPMVPAVANTQTEPRLPAVYVGFDTWSAIGGTLRKQLDPKRVTWTPKGLVYPKLATSGGALKIDASRDQFLWLDLDADLVVPPNRDGTATSTLRSDRGQDVAWPRGVPMGTPGTTLYLSFLIRAEQPVAHGFCGVSFAYGSDDNFFVGKARGVPGFSYDFAAVHKTLLDADPTTLSTRPITLDTATHLIVTRVDFREGEDRFAIYFDPDPTKPEPKQANGTGVGHIALDRIRISAGRGMDRQGGARWYLDEIRLADRYAVAVPVASDSGQTAGQAAGSGNGPR